MKREKWERVRRERERDTRTDRLVMKEKEQMTGGEFSHCT